MKSYKSDIEIARLAKLKPIQEILGNINMEDKAEYYSPIGRYMAKVKLEYLNRLKNKENGKLIWLHVRSFDFLILLHAGDLDV